jgi:hypothetical protein
MKTVSYYVSSSELKRQKKKKKDGVANAVTICVSLRFSAWDPQTRDLAHPQDDDDGCIQSAGKKVMAQHISAFLYNSELL